MKRSFALLVAASLSSIGLSGCSTPPGLPETLPAEKVHLPADWQAPAPQGSVASERDDWWSELRDPQLSSLIESALRDAHNVKAAAARLDAARAYARQVGAGLYPEIGLASDSGRGKTRSTSTNAVSRPHYLRAAASASWELDFWGKNRNLRESALASADKSLWAARAVRLSLAGSIAREYIGWLGSLRKLDLAVDSLETMQKTLEIVRSRRGLGTATDVDVSSSEAELASRKADADTLRLEAEQHEHALALLASRPELRLRRPATLELPCPAVRPGLPSELLQNRPDVRQAEAALRSSHAEIAAAYAAFFPSISLTGSAGTQSRELSGLFGASIWSLGVSLDLPIFDFGRRTARYEETKAAERAALEAYRQAAEQAYGDVRDALSSTRYLKDIEESRRTSLEASQRALLQALDRYRLGGEGFLTVLTAQRTFNSAAASLADARSERLYAYVSFNEALGAGASEEKP